MTERSIAHGSFTVERKYKHAPSKVYSAWSNPEFQAPVVRLAEPGQAQGRHGFPRRRP